MVKIIDFGEKKFLVPKIFQNHRVPPMKKIFWSNFFETGFMSLVLSLVVINDIFMI